MSQIMRFESHASLHYTVFFTQTDRKELDFCSTVFLSNLARTSASRSGCSGCFFCFELLCHDYLVLVVACFVVLAATGGLHALLLCTRGEKLQVGLVQMGIYVGQLAVSVQVVVVMHRMDIQWQANWSEKANFGASRGNSHFCGSVISTDSAG